MEMDGIREWPLSPEDLANASEVLLMNSLIGVLPVSRINRREIPVGPEADGCGPDRDALKPSPPTPPPADLRRPPA